MSQQDLYNAIVLLLLKSYQPTLPLLPPLKRLKKKTRFGKLHRLGHGEVAWKGPRDLSMKGFHLSSLDSWGRGKGIYFPEIRGFPFQTATFWGFSLCEVAII